MLNNILTEDVFREGLTRYLTHYAEGNANSDKLWDALNQVCEFSKTELLPVSFKRSVTTLT